MKNKDVAKRMSFIKKTFYEKNEMPLEIREKIRKTLRTRVELNCLNCKALFYPKTKMRKFCTSRCYNSFKAKNKNLYFLKQVHSIGDGNPMSYKSIMIRFNCDLEEARQIRKNIIKGNKV